MKQEIIVNMKALRGNLMPCLISYETKKPWIIMLESKIINYETSPHKDLFESLCELRLYLEKNDLFLLCNGARIDAYPSRMSREFGGALKLYILELGRQSRLDDLVDIFGEAPVEKVATVADQKNYYKHWLESLG